jgi:hypothetical protein
MMTNAMGLVVIAFVGHGSGKAAIRIGLRRLELY